MIEGFKESRVPLEDIIRSEVLGDMRKRNMSISKAVLEHG